MRAPNPLNVLSILSLGVAFTLSPTAAAQGFPGSGGFPGGGGPGGGPGGPGGGDATGATDCASEATDAEKIDCLIAWVDALSEHIRVDGGALEVDGHATQSWVSGQSYASEQWVEEQGYADAGDLADNAAAISSNASRIAGMEASEVDLTGYATEAWVSGQGFGAASDVAANAAGIAQNASDIAGIDTSGIATNAANITRNASDIADIDLSGVDANAAAIASVLADYLTSGDLAGYATEAWVQAQGFGLAADVSQNATDIESNVWSIVNNGLWFGEIVETLTADLESASSAASANTSAITSLQAEVAGNSADLDTVFADYLVAVDLSGFATQAWVESQGYSTGGVAGLDAYLSVDTSTDSVVFSGANVYVQSGSGATDGEVNGLGNLVVGYDEDMGDLHPSWPNDKSGSHNLVVGTWHSYPSYGGLVAGYGNSVNGTYASITGGMYGTADGDNSSIHGGMDNVTTGYVGAVLGGYKNTASGWYSAVSGGQHNDASGESSAVSGGNYNNASGQYASISGGIGGTAAGMYSAIAGGLWGYAEGESSTVAGGESNYTVGATSTISGGGGNVASGHTASVSGGGQNTASGHYTSIVGGNGNNATSFYEVLP